MISSIVIESSGVKSTIADPLFKVLRKRAINELISSVLTLILIRAAKISFSIDSTNTADQIEAESNSPFSKAFRQFDK